MRTITQTLNMTPGGVPPVIHVSQYDSDFTITFTLFSLFGGFTIESDTTAQIRGTKSSGTGYSADAAINISAKTVTVTGNAQMTAAAGQNIFEIVLKRNNKEISSKNFILLVERAALDADTITDESVLRELNAIVEGADTATRAAEDANDAADRAEAAAQSLVVDPAPTQGSANAVSSGGVYEALQNIDVSTDTTLSISGKPADAKAVGDTINTLIGGDEQREITGWVYSKYINVANANVGDTVDITNVSSFYSLKYVVVDCEEGDKFLLNLAGAASARAWAFLTNNNVLISRADASVTLSNEEITAPENAGKAIFQCIYRPTQDDTTTDNGTVYKYVLGSGNVVRFDISQDKTEAEKARARENLGISSGEGLSDEAKAALLDCFRNVAWINDAGQTYYAALYNALYGGDTPSENINVTFNANGRTFYTDDPIESLKNYLTVTYNGTATANYDLVGAFSQNNIKVKIGNEYSGVIPVQAEVIKRSLSTADGDITFLNAGVKMTGERVPELDTQTTTKRAVGMTQGRIKYGNSNTWYSVPMPADCTEITVNVEPSTFKYYITAWKFDPQANTCTYFSESALVSGTHKHTVQQNDGLLVVTIMIQNRNNTTITTEPTKCEIEFS